MIITDEIIPLDPKSGIVVAFSGGADSLALLLALVARVDKGKLVAVYVNHRLRLDTELVGEEELNQSNCAKLGVPLRIIRLERGAVEAVARSRGNGIEDAARVLRYEALRKVRQELNFSYIATAHTADDQAETLLMRLLQGSGPQGLQGIASHERDLVRPLLQWTKNDVLTYVRESGLKWSEDSTNSSLMYLRNQIRHEIIPMIERVFPHYREALKRVSLRSSAYCKALEPAVHRAIEQVVTVQEQAVLLDLALLETLARAIAEQVLYHGWSLVTENSGKRFPYRHLEQLLDKIATGWDRGATLYLSNSVVMRQNDTLVWKKQSSALVAGYVSLLYSKQTPLDGTKVLVVGEELHSSIPLEERARIDSETVTRPLVVRSCKAGDRIVLKEGTKAVTSLLASWKIVSHERWRVPVLEDREGIVAVLASAYGGRDRVAKRCLLSGLARSGSTLYSVTDIEGYDCE